MPQHEADACQRCSIRDPRRAASDVRPLGRQPQHHRSPQALADRLCLCHPQAYSPAGPIGRTHRRWSELRTETSTKSRKVHARGVGLDQAESLRLRPCADHVNCQSPVYRVAVGNGSLLAELLVPPTPCALGGKDVRGGVVPLFLASIPTYTAATVHIRRARDRQECSGGPQRTTVPARPQRLGNRSVCVRGAGEHAGCDEKRICEPPDGS
jgi:hypothetical protein